MRMNGLGGNGISSKHKTFNNKAISVALRNVYVEIKKLVIPPNNRPTQTVIQILIVWTTTITQ